LLFASHLSLQWGACFRFGGVTLIIVIARLLQFLPGLCSQLRHNLHFLILEFFQQVLAKVQIQELKQSFTLFSHLGVLMAQCPVDAEQELSEQGVGLAIDNLGLLLELAKKF